MKKAIATLQIKLNKNRLHLKCTTAMTSSYLELAGTRMLVAIPTPMEVQSSIATTEDKAAYLCKKVK